jgi:ubiquinone biosynthesis protein Coq4
VARCLDEHGFEAIASGDWVQGNHDVWPILTGLSASTEDEFVLQAFTRSSMSFFLCDFSVI